MRTCWPNMVRTDSHQSRRVAADSPQAEAVKVLPERTRR